MILSFCNEVELEHHNPLWSRLHLLTTFVFFLFASFGFIFLKNWHRCVVGFPPFNFILPITVEDLWNYACTRSSFWKVSFCVLVKPVKSNYFLNLIKDFWRLLLLTLNLSPDSFPILIWDLKKEMTTPTQEREKWSNIS